MKALQRSTLLMLALLMSAGVQPANSASVLVLSSGNAAEDTSIEYVLESFGHSVDVGPQYINYNGTTNLAGYQSVVLLTNYNWNALPLDMPAAGQTQLLNYVSAGGGLVAGEWLVWKTGAQNVFNTLEPAIPVVATTAFRTAAQVTYSQVAAEPTLNSGLPDSFTFFASNIGGTETQFNPKSGATIFYDSSYPTAGSGVIGWDFGAGRVISFSTLIAEEELADANYVQLFSNAVSWSAGVVIPEPSSATSICIGAGLSMAAIALRRRRERI
jgi:hypothetical protein